MTLISNHALPLTPTPLTTTSSYNNSGQLAAQNEENVGAEFESVFMSLLVSTMRKSSFGEGLFPGDKSDTLGGLFDMMVAGQIADSGGIGVRELVENWLADRSLTKDEHDESEQQTGGDASVIAKP